LPPDLNPDIALISAVKFFFSLSDKGTISIKANHSKEWDAKLLAFAFFIRAWSQGCREF